VDAGDRVTAASEALEAGDFARTLTLLESLIRIEPVSPDENFLVGFAHGLTGEAFEWTDRAESACHHYGRMRSCWTASGRLTCANEAERRFTQVNYARWSHMLAGVLHGLGRDLDSAIQYRLDASAMLADLGEDALAARALRDVADIERQLGDTEAAERHVRAAHELYVRLDDRIMVANCQLGLGDVYLDRGALAEARPLYRAAARLLRGCEDAVLDRAHAALACHDVAETHAEAQEALREARALYQQHLDAAKRNGEAVQLAKDALSRCFQTMGKAAQAAGLYDDARHYYIEAERLVAAEGARLAALDARTHQAGLALARGHNLEALESALQLEGEYRDAGYLPGQFECRLVAIRALRFTQPRVAAARTAEVISEADGLGLVEVRRTAQCLLADMLVAEAAAAGAQQRQDLLEQARQLVEAAMAGPWDGAERYAGRLETRAGIARQEMRGEDAARHYREATDIYARLGSIREAGCLYLEACVAHQLLDRQHDALDLVRRSLRLLEERRLRLSAPVVRNEFGRSWEDVYHLAVKLELAFRHAGAAFSHLLALYGRLITEEFEDSKATSDAPPIHPKLAPPLALRGDPVSAFEALRTRNELLDVMRFATRRSNPRRSPAPEDTYQGPARAVFAWEPECHVAIVRHSDGTFEPVDYDASGTAAAIDRHLMSIERLTGEFRGVGDATPAMFDAPVRGLQALFWEPLVVALRGERALVTLPGALARVPVTSLALACGDAVDLSPTLSVSVGERQDMPPAILAVAANPEGDLHGPQRDLAIAAQAFGPQHLLVRPDEDSAAVLLSSTARTQILFIATHMKGEHSAHSSGILLGPRGSPRLVTLYELLGVQIQAHVVILAGCQSAAVSSGPGLFSVASALFASTGAATLLATTSSVTDAAATLVWSELAPRLAAGMEAREALSQALGRLDHIGTQHEVAVFLREFSKRYPELAEAVGELGDYLATSAARHRRGLLPADRLCWVVFRR
jgi:tetratricopeptide (TPR) repeat protein